MAKPIPAAAPTTRSRFLVHMLLCLCGSMLFLYWQLTTHSSLSSLLHAGPAGSPSVATGAVPLPVPAPSEPQMPLSSDDLVTVHSKSGHRFKHVPYVAADVAVLRWGIMFDAGSTGSRVHIYRFRMPDAAAAEGGTEANGAAPQPLLEDEIFVEVKPGLSAFVPSGVGADQSTRDVGAPSAKTPLGTGPDAAAASLRGLMDLCMEMIPTEAHGRTPVSLRATAGLRLLGEETAESILVSIRTLFGRYPFQFDPVADVAVMRGSEEGVFAWLTVNYLAGQLQDYKVDEATAQARHDAQRKAHPHAHAHAHAAHDAHAALTHHHPRTSAILDLGGASTQIVFEPDFPSFRSLAPSAQQKLYPLPYGTNTYYLYETSYLGFGLMEARRKVKAALVATPGLQVHPLVPPNAAAEEARAAGVVGVEVGSISAEGNPVKFHPCISDGHSESIAIETELESDSGGEGESESESDQVELRGYAQGHASCAEVVRTLFAKDAPCELEPFCSFGGHFALPLHGMFAKTELAPPAAAAAGAFAHSPHHSLEGAQAKIFAFSYFYDRTLDVFDLPEESGPRAAADGGGTVVQLGRLRQLADQVCAFSMAEHRVRSAASIEEEKEAARAALQKAVEKRHSEGCRTVTVQQADGSTRLVALPDQAASTASDVAATADLPALDKGSCMVEERPDLSAEAEKKRANISSELVDAIGENPYLCLDLTYAHTLLHYGYDLPESIELHIMKRMQKKEIGWCLGAMLAQMAQRGW